MIKENEIINGGQQHSTEQNLFKQKSILDFVQDNYFQNQRHFIIIEEHLYSLTRYAREYYITFSKEWAF